MASPDFAAAAARIESNPLGRLMYGQRELFHSNLLGWFFDLLPTLADEVFLPLSKPGVGSARRVERERQNMDVVMHWPGHKPLVIENKVFSIPGAQQLETYALAAAAWQEDPALVVLSVSRPDFELNDWTYVSYSEFAARLEQALPEGGPYEVETMRRYAALVRDLHDLVSAVDVQSSDEQVWLSDELLSAISSSQMRAALHKARAHRVARALNTAVELGDPAKGGMSNSTPLVESFEYVRSSGLHLHLGWQLQGSQLRRAVVHHDQSIAGHSAESRRAREDASREHPEFFTFPHPAPQQRSGRKEFNHFAPNFVYQYVKAESLTIAELTEIARAVHVEIQALADPGSVGANAATTRRVGQLLEMPELVTTTGSRPAHAVRRTP